MYSTGPLEYLIQNGANVNAADSGGRTPIHYGIINIFAFYFAF